MLQQEELSVTISKFEMPFLTGTSRCRPSIAPASYPSAMAAKSWLTTGWKSLRRREYESQSSEGGHDKVRKNG